MSRATRVLVFDTTHHALWAEEIARDLLLGVEIVPAPPASNAGCDLAIEALDSDLAALIAELRERGILFRVHERGTATSP